ESDDYATQLLGDAWDMNNPEDVNSPHDLVNFGFSGGVWHGTTTSPSSASIMLQYQNFDTGYSSMGEKDGRNYPVDQSRFTRLWFRMYSNTTSQTLLWFFRHLDYAGAGNSNFVTINSGWHIYSADLRSTGACAICT